MRCSEFNATPSVPCIYTCGRCSIFYYNHQTLLEHLYWRHGTESDVCRTCKLKKWSFANHKCYHLPNMDCNVGNRNRVYKSRSGDDDCDQFVPIEVVRMHPHHEGSDTESVASGDSSYFSERESPYCYCGKDIENSQMIGCDSDSCVLEWYHYKCVGITEVPAGTWHCPECVQRIK